MKEREKTLTARLVELGKQERLGELDCHLARMLFRRHNRMETDAALAAALTSHALQEGHTCLPLTNIAEILAKTGIATSADSLHERLLASGAAVLAEQATANPAPLVLDAAGNLALLRWHHAESRIAQALLQRAQGVEKVDEVKAREWLARLFPKGSDAHNAPNLQKTAAALALCKRLVILCGGPGTGKTWTLARILALSAALSNPEKPLRLALTAPTGRAAMRLGEAIKEATAALTEKPDALQSLPDPQTLHRLLGYQPHNNSFRRNAENLLPVDLVVVDEASMVDDLVLDALLAALPAHCRLILCGDPGQLPPVEPGSLLHALHTATSRESAYTPELAAPLTRLVGETEVNTAGTTPSNSLADCRITLKTTHRFDQKSGISALAMALQAPRPGEALAQVLNKKWPDIDLIMPEEAGRKLPDLLLNLFQPIYAARNAAEALHILSHYRVLCAVREGDWGVNGINSRCEKRLHKEGLITHWQEYYRGLPILIQHNAHDLGLFNGDTGIIWPDTSGELKAWFPDAKEARHLAPATLPSWQPAWAMTVHKAQGAEFDEVMCILPKDGNNPLLTQELLYTAITRTKKHLSLVATPELLATVATTRLPRHSALGTLLAQTGGIAPQQANFG